MKDTALERITNHLRKNEKERAFQCMIDIANAHAECEDYSRCIDTLAKAICIANELADMAESRDND